MPENPAQLQEGTVPTQSSSESDRVCLICGLLDSEGGCDHLDNCKREAVVVEPERLRRALEEIAGDHDGFYGNAATVARDARDALTKPEWRPRGGGEDF